MEKIKMVVLTMSSKFRGNCVAGIKLSDGSWVRLVTGDESSRGALSNEDLICENGKKVEVLDVIYAPVVEACDDDIQPENVLLDMKTKIEIVGRMSMEEVLKVHPLEGNRYILGNIYPYIIEERVGRIGYSLTMVAVNNLEIIQETNPSGNPKTKVNFNYKGCRYEKMSVTDGRFYCVNSGTTYRRAILVVSIGTPYKNRYYKFVSAIYV